MEKKSKKKAVQKMPQPQIIQTQQMQPPMMQQMQMQPPMMQQQMQMNNVQQMQMPVSRQRNVRGGVYGAQSPNNEDMIFNDDEPLIERVKQETKQGKIDIQIKAQHSMVKLKQQTLLPAMASVTSSGGSRTSVDLICVIDNSGSMSGEKIQLVRDTLKFLVQTLTPSDRISLIIFNSFATRLCPLKCVTGENMGMLNDIINKIHSGGGTDINSGMDLALKTIRERKHVNTVTSIFLLSDGQDGGAAERLQHRLYEPANKEIGVFTIHSFGFGNDHDEELMTKICELRDGTFYYIKELGTLDEAFCNALGGIISLVANEITIKVSNIAKNLVEGIRITKVYGDSWQKITDKEYKIKISQLMSGISKDFVFELMIPNINTEVGDIDREHSVIQGIFLAKGVNGENMSGQCVLRLTLLNENQEIPEVNENIDVIQNYLRVRASEAIEENLKKADHQQYEQAQKGIDNMINYIQSNKKARKEKMEYLVNDLNQIRSKCQDHSSWQSEGRKWAKNAEMAHKKQKNYQYSNAIQTEMVSKRQQMKRKS